MPKKRFKWVQIYWHSSNTLHLRLIPQNVNVEALGFPHGIALAQTFTSTEDAEAYKSSPDYPQTVAYQEERDRNTRFPAEYKRDCGTDGL